MRVEIFSICPSSRSICNCSLCAQGRERERETLLHLSSDVNHFHSSWLCETGKEKKRKKKREKREVSGESPGSKERAIWLVVRPRVGGWGGGKTRREKCHFHGLYSNECLEKAPVKKTSNHCRATGSCKWNELEKKREKRKSDWPHGCSLVVTCSSSFVTFLLRDGSISQETRESDDRFIMHFVSRWSLSWR